MSSPPFNTPGSFSFTVKQGADLSISLTWTDDNGNPTDLTGVSMKMAIRQQFGSQPLVTLDSDSTTGSHIVVGGASGSVEIFLAAADTKSFPAGFIVVNSSALGQLPLYRLGVYDLQYTMPDGTVGYLLEGIVYLDPQVTQ
ncbi:hypothetical protein [Burkholderia vietnamiensis]|uniref:hypothetical protein n=1 Tax=Burkholderia vietnamiensis TaxID=60552 RepID=UPI0015945E98|nr:hypothetical protein [Burkholderia vietnamiensis]MCA7948489.1 hypothetical protein [Burkholderia vietnamiensis]